MAALNSFTFLNDWHDFECDKLNNDYLFVESGLSQTKSNYFKLIYFGIEGE